MSALHIFPSFCTSLIILARRSSLFFTTLAYARARAALSTIGMLAVFGIEGDGAEYSCGGLTSTTDADAPLASVSGNFSGGLTSGVATSGVSGGSLAPDSVMTGGASATTGSRIVGGCTSACGELACPAVPAVACGEGWEELEGAESSGVGSLGDASTGSSAMQKG